MLGQLRRLVADLRRKVDRGGRDRRLNVQVAHRGYDPLVPLVIDAVELRAVTVGRFIDPVLDIEILTSRR
ncbi:hypothetical protein LSP04_23660 [Levilactobacillus spicheri]|uniref:Uncharacterized protein n=1 Tax=Levilactobacillus spicheri TaxID=216463 RepID=A0ABQ0WSV3_9LACO|nr:hypothetical protein LSP04_23660 [Levilactobacillus spicheri]